MEVAECTLRAVDRISLYGPQYQSILSDLIASSVALYRIPVFMASTQSRVSIGMADAGGSLTWVRSSEQDMGK